MKTAPVVLTSLVFSAVVAAFPTAAFGDTVLRGMQPTTSIGATLPWTDITTIPSSATFYVPDQSLSTQVLTQPAVLEPFSGRVQIVQPRYMVAPPFLFNIEKRRRDDTDLGSLDYGTDMFPTW